jgi:hypothetical protein
MPLPKIATPYYTLELPSTGEEIEYRPFLVKEEKILVLAMESQDTKQITKAIKDVIKSCVKSKVKVEDLPTFDIEYLFLNIRGKSVGEEVEVRIICPDDGETEVPVTVPIDEIKVQKNPDHNRDIKLDQFVSENFDLSDDIGIEKTFDLISSCIETIYNEDEAWSSADVTKKELSEFLEQLNTSQFKDIEQFFETMPKLSYKVEVTNPKTKKKSEVVLEGISSFFA